MKHAVLIAGVTAALAVTLLAGCASRPAGLGRAAAADSRLTAEIQRLPVPAGALLVEQLITDLDVRMPECQGRLLQALYGTNDMSVDEVLEFYESSLHGTKWAMTDVDKRSRAFAVGDELSMDVSDYLLLGRFGSERLKDARASFKTVSVDHEKD